MELLKGSHFIYYVVICMNLKKSKDTVWFLYYNLCCEKLHSFYNSYTICLFYLYLKTIYMKQSVYVNYWSFMRWLHSHFSLKTSCLLPKLHMSSGFCHAESSPLTKLPLKTSSHSRGHGSTARTPAASTPSTQDWSRHAIGSVY